MSKRIDEEISRLKAELFELVITGPFRRMVDLVNQIQNLETQKGLGKSSNLD